MLAASRATEAEAVYREDLRRNPGNGWSLKGLALSLDRQDRPRETRDTEKLLATAWQHADVSLTASVF